MSPEWGLLLLQIVTLSVSAPYFVVVRQAGRQLPRLVPSSDAETSFLATQTPPRISVIVPAYNEADNIADCVRSILASTHLPESLLEFWVVDDQSTDQTWEILQNLKHELADPRFKLLAGMERPTTEVWVGKNWACLQASNKANGDWLLFLDADVRLKPGAIATALQEALEHQFDFLTCVPAIISGSLVEWLVQPLMFVNLMVAFNSAIVKNPRSPVTFALGPFLLFRRTTYEAIGGHAAVARQVAEDVALARKVKRHGYRLHHVLGPTVAGLRMYRNWAGLWEGWTKVLYVGSNRNLFSMVLLVIVMTSVYTIPWLSLLAALVVLATGHFSVGTIALLLALVGIALQFQVRNIGSQALGTSMRFWWLQWAGGLLISLMGAVSVIKAWTGWGWTWRGRSLKAGQ